MEDRVSQLLGYREYVVEIPNFGTVEPRPAVKQVSPKRYSEASLAKFIDIMGENGVPNVLFEVDLSRNIDEQVIVEGGFWRLQREDQVEAMRCILLQYVVKDARFVCTLGLVKTDVYVSPW